MKAKPWYSISYMHVPNLGDRICQPHHYFDLPLTDCISWKQRNLPDVNYLSGGGGIDRSRLIRLIQLHPQARIITWAHGWIYRQVQLLHPVPGVEHFSSRDWGQGGAEWTPCPSCMNEWLDKDYPIERDVGLYFNPDFPLPQVGMDIERRNNLGEEPEIFSWLGGCELVLTNSYHGAYWATLLGRKVIVVNPHSGKFMYFHPSMQMPVCVASEWRNQEPRVADGSLEMCREVNRKYYDKVMNWMAE